MLPNEVGSKTQSSRPRNQKQSEAKAKDSPSEADPLEAKGRNTRGQGQGPRTQAQVFSEKKVSKNFFQAISKRGKQKGLCKFSARFLAFSNKNLIVQKNSAVLEPMQRHRCKCNQNCHEHSLPRDRSKPRDRRSRRPIDLCRTCKVAGWQQCAEHGSAKFKSKTDIGANAARLTMGIVGQKDITHVEIGD